MATHEIQVEAPSTNSLNGMPDPDVSTSTEYKLDQQKKQTKQQHAKKTKTDKESTPIPTVGTAAPREGVSSNTTATTVAPDNRIASSSANYPFDPVMDFWIPFTLVIAVFVTVFKIMWWMAKKCPSKGGYVHIPKHPHPGKPKPHITKHK